MYKILKFELYRAFHGKTFLTALAIGIALGLIDILMSFIRFGTPPDIVLLSVWIGSDFQFVWHQVFYLILPILAALPYGGSYYTDRRRCYDREICLKTSRNRYLAAKTCAVFISSFVCITMPLCLNLFIAAGLYPDLKPQVLDPSTLSVIDTGLFSSLFFADPVWFCLAYIIVDGLFAGVIGLMAFAVTGLCRSHFMTVTFPWLFCMICNTVFETNEKLFSWSPLYMIDPINSRVQWYQMLTVYLLLFAGSVSCIFVSYGKKDIL